jgi:hypothetical protein
VRAPASPIGSQAYGDLPAEAQGEGGVEGVVPLYFALLETFGG